jgi:hypothetical protein
MQSQVFGRELALSEAESIVHFPAKNLFAAQNLIQFAVAVAAALIRTVNPRRLVRPSARVL